MIFTIFIGILCIVLFTSSLTPTFAIEYKVTTDNSKVQCRQEQVLVYRFYGKDYLCIDVPAALRWSQLNLAQIIEIPTQIIEPPTQIQEVDKKDGCIIDLVRVYRVNVDKNACVKESTAKKWQEIGIVIILDDEFKQKVIESIKEKEVSASVKVESDERALEIEEYVLEIEDEIYVMQDSVRIEPNNDIPLAQAWCNSGDYATGGGYTIEKGLDTMYIYRNMPIKDESNNINGWEVGAQNNGYTSQALIVYVVCQVP